MSLAALLVKPVADRGPRLTGEAFVVGSVAVVAETPKKDVRAWVRRCELR
jgi:hypothetical protein